MTRYGGFWLRFLACWIDVFLLLIIITPLLLWIYGTENYVSSPMLIHGPADLFLNYILPLIVTLIFWHYRSATPGKMICRLIIVDAQTLQKPSTKQFVIRYFAYIISTLPLFLGYFWIAFDDRKQAWHDKIAKTVVIKKD